MIKQPYMVKQFNKLLGDLKHIGDEKDAKAYQRVVLATTMWNKVEVGDLAAFKRERHIQQEYWNIMETAGASMTRFDNTSKCARHILESVVDAKKLGDPVYQHRKVMREFGVVVSERSLFRSIRFDVSSEIGTETCSRGHKRCTRGTEAAYPGPRGGCTDSRAG